MKNCSFIYMGLFVIMLSASPVKADVEVAESVLSGLVSVPADKLKALQDLKSSIDSMEQVVRQTGKDIKNTVNQAKNVYNNAKSKAQDIVSKAKNISEAIKTGNIQGALATMGGGKLEFAGLKGTLNGDVADEDAIEAVDKVCLRGEGPDSIATQEELNLANDKRQGEKLSRLYAKGLILQQELQEEDENE